MHRRPERAEQSQHLVAAEHDRQSPGGSARGTERAQPSWPSVLAKKKRSPAAYTFRVEAW